MDAELLFDSGNDSVAKREDVGGLRFSAIDQSQRMAAGDTCRAERIALVKTRLLYQPGGWQFEESFSSRIARNPIAESGRDASEVDRADDRILEEAACAAAVGIAVDDEHAFLVADASNRCAYVGK